MAVLEVKEILYAYKNGKPVLLNVTAKRSTLRRSSGSLRKASRLSPRAMPIHRAGKATAISS